MIDWNVSIGFGNMESASTSIRRKYAELISGDSVIGQPLVAITGIYWDADQFGAGEMLVRAFSRLFYATKDVQDTSALGVEIDGVVAVADVLSGFLSVLEREDVGVASIVFINRHGSAFHESLAGRTSLICGLSDFLRYVSSSISDPASSSQWGMLSCTHVVAAT